MKKHEKPLLTVIISIMLCVFACVTVNIYFPAEKVESVAEDIVGEIRGEEAEESSKNDKTSLLQRTVMALTCSVAWAEDAVTVSNATIRALKQQMKSRYAQMKPYYQQGKVIEGDDGYVSQGSAEGLSLKEKRDLKGLVNAENKDRARLYSEVAKAMDIEQSQVNRIAEIFAKEWK
ncbi:MAG: DUF1318 domain-containing protein [Deltaproteobacteria bacterium]|nr:DUF1318 domain-containing protein [Deltaproteobacteria bacterium]MBW2172564.1 DUF1318 domain-containing protein [Deltaproteobacteria bacterium]